MAVFKSSSVSLSSDVFTTCYTMAAFRHRICTGTITILVNSFVPGRAATND
jgi:hypothetical protein